MQRVPREKVLLFPSCTKYTKTLVFCTFPSAARRSSSLSCSADVPQVSRSTRGPVSQDRQVILAALRLGGAALRLP